MQYSSEPPYKLCTHSNFCCSLRRGVLRQPVLTGPKEAGLPNFTAEADPEVQHLDQRDSHAWLATSVHFHRTGFAEALAVLQLPGLLECLAEVPDLMDLQVEAP